MQGKRIAKAMFLACSCALLVGGCTLPRSGPTAGEIRNAAAAPEYDMHIVTVTPAVAAASRSYDALGFSSSLVNAPEISPDVIASGDTLGVRVWENVDAGLLAGVGQRAAPIEALQVDQSGSIFIPYVGRVQAAGKTPNQVRQIVTEGLQTKTPDPQVEVIRSAGDGATVSVNGGVREPGVYPIQAPTRRLSAMLARAGGVAVVPDVAQVVVERNGRTERIWLQDLYDNPRYDIALRPNDRVIVEEDRRSFTALGAATNQQRIAFNKHNMSALEAIAAAGGLNGRSADPTGVFIFRRETAEVANRVLGRTDLVGPQRVTYVIDLTKPEGLFSAREFIIRDEDTVYITEAPLAAWSRVIGIAGATVNLGANIATLDGL